MSDIAVEIKGLSKRFYIGQRHVAYRTLRSTVADAFTAPFKRVRRLLSGHAYGAADLNESIWALKDLTLEIKRGEVVGIIGQNGAGKSTLLKILSRITEPTEGYARIYGHVGALLEVGTGFHTELTGRENIYLNAAILGMRHAEIHRKFDEIVSFAEIDQFIDTPVKHYSSGMVLRLGFAVAAHMEPEILIVDEVLAVGDAAFQRKCIGKMGEVAGDGRTVLFVSHNMGAVRSLCESGVWLENGKIREVGTASQTVANYMNALESQSMEFASGPIQILGVILRNSQGIQTQEFMPGEDIEVEVRYHANKQYDNPHFWFSIQGSKGPICVASMLIDGQCPPSIEGDGAIKCRFMNVPLIPERYMIMMGVRDKHGRDKLLPAQDVASFFVSGSLFDLGYVGERAHIFANDYSVMFPYEWTYSDGHKTVVSMAANQEEAVRQLSVAKKD